MRNNSQQLWLPFTEILPKELPATPEAPHYAEPKDDNQRLLNYQWQYKNGDKTALDHMYKCGMTIAMKYINNAAHHNKHVRAMDFDTRWNKAHNAASYVIIQYITRPDFVIAQSYTAYLFLRVRHELYYRTKADGLVEYCDNDRMAQLTFKRY